MKTIRPLHQHIANRYKIFSSNTGQMKWEKAQSNIEKSKVKSIIVATYSWRIHLRRQPPTLCLPNWFFYSFVPSRCAQNHSSYDLRNIASKKKYSGFFLKNNVITSTLNCPNNSSTPTKIKFLSILPIAH
jgi:hypothetical protein